MWVDEDEILRTRLCGFMGNKQKSTNKRQHQLRGYHGDLWVIKPDRKKTFRKSTKIRTDFDYEFSNQVFCQFQNYNFAKLSTLTFLWIHALFV